MDFGDFVGWIQARPALKREPVVLDDPDASGHDLAEGYFQVRLSEMFLRDERRWMQEIVPTAFVLADYQYGAERVRQPFFVGNSALSGVAGDIDINKLRVQLRDTLVVGPTPYAGGDVGLFVGLFQSPIEDHRKTLFSVFDTLFGNLPVGMLSDYIKLADKLSGAITQVLGADGIQCRLAHYSVIGKGILPAPHYLLYVQAGTGGPLDPNGLEVRQGTLQRRTRAGLVPVDDLDYCLLRIERMAARNDYSKLDFHRVWSEARAKLFSKQPQEAQALMLACARQVLDSPDLTENHKVELIKFYQAKLLAGQVMLDSLENPNPTAARRAGGPSYMLAMQQQAKKVGGIAGGLHQSFDEIAKLSSAMVNQETGTITQDMADAARTALRPAGVGFDISNDKLLAQLFKAPLASDQEIADHLAAMPPAATPVRPALLVKALTTGSLR